MLKRHNLVILLVMTVGDVCVTAGAWASGYGFRYLGGEFGWTKEAMPSLSAVIEPVILSLVLTPFVFIWSGLYAPAGRRPYRRNWPPSLDPSLRSGWSSTSCQSYCNTISSHV